MIVNRRSVSATDARELLKAALACEFVSVGRLELGYLDESGSNKLGSCFIAIHSEDSELSAAVSELVLSALQAWGESVHAGG